MADTRLRSVDDALTSLQAMTGAPARRAEPRAPRRRATFSLRGLLLKLGFLLAVVVVVAVLPFVALVRLSVWAHLDHGWPAWLALASGVAAMALVLAVYAVVLLRRRPAARRWAVRAACATAVCFGGYGVLYISAANVKSASVHATYTALHPLLRLAVGTLVWVDGDLVVTDAARQPDDYGRMGLPVFERSLHFEQVDGYVHAVDLRTLGRPEWQNRLVERYFAAAGFETLRHVGTADHLHVALPVMEAR